MSNVDHNFSSFSLIAFLEREASYISSEQSTVSNYKLLLYHSNCQFMVISVKFLAHCNFACLGRTIYMHYLYPCINYVYLLSRVSKFLVYLILFLSGIKL